MQPSEIAHPCHPCMQGAPEWMCECGKNDDGCPRCGRTPEYCGCDTLAVRASLEMKNV